MLVQIENLQEFIWESSYSTGEIYLLDYKLGESKGVVTWLHRFYSTLQLTYITTHLISLTKSKRSSSYSDHPPSVLI